MATCGCPEIVEDTPAIRDGSFISHSLAGAAAGMAETAAMYPLDTIKTRMQACTYLASSCSAVQNTLFTVTELIQGKQVH